MEDGFDTTSQTSTVFTHESRIFSLENDSSQDDTVLLNMKLESQDSPQSPSLLPTDDLEEPRNVTAEIGSDIGPNVMVASVDSHNSYINLKDCNVSTNSPSSDFIFSKPEATWVRDHAFVNLSTPWIQRNESDQKQCVKFFSDLIHKATEGYPICLILPIILQQKKEDILNLINLLNKECFKDTQDFEGNLPSPNQELVETDLEDEGDDISKIEEWVNSTTLSNSIVSRSEENTALEEDMGTTDPKNDHGSDNLTVNNLSPKSKDKDEDIDLSNVDITPEKTSKDETVRKTPKKKSSNKENIDTPVKKAKTRLTFDIDNTAKQNPDPATSIDSNFKGEWINKKTNEQKTEEKPKNSKTKSVIQCKIDALKDLIPDSAQFQNDEEFLAAFNFIKTSNSLSPSKKCSVCDCKEGTLFEMYYYQYENVSDSAREHHLFCFDCFTAFKHIKDVKKATFYELIYDLTHSGVTAQYESMLPNGNVRFRIRSRKRWFDNLKLHFEDLKDFFDMTIPTGKNQGGISFDVMTSDKIKDDIRSEATVLGSNCNFKLKFLCYAIHRPKSPSMTYKLELTQLGKENSTNSILRRNSTEESITPNRKQPGLTKYFRPI